jgi:hypothetical protein
MKIDNKYLQECAEHVFSSIEAYGADQGVLLDVKTRFAPVIEAGFDSDAIDYCINNFVAAEVDFLTTGNRGLGRSTEHTPRLGGYFRNKLSSFSVEKKTELENAIRKYILDAYMGMVILSSQNTKIPHDKKTPDNLYQKWVSTIYVFPIDQLGEGALFFLQAATATSVMALRKFLKENQMKGGSLFSSDKTEEILSGYAAAGVALQRSEVT